MEQFNLSWTSQEVKLDPHVFLRVTKELVAEVCPSANVRFCTKVQKQPTGFWASVFGTGYNLVEVDAPEEGVRVEKTGNVFENGNPEGISFFSKITFSQSIENGRPVVKASLFRSSTCGEDPVSEEAILDRLLKGGVVTPEADALETGEKLVQLHLPFTADDWGQPISQTLSIEGYGQFGGVYEDPFFFRASDVRKGWDTAVLRMRERQAAETQRALAKMSEALK